MKKASGTFKFWWKKSRIFLHKVFHFFIEKFFFEKSNKTEKVEKSFKKKSSALILKISFSKFYKWLVDKWYH